MCVFAAEVSELCLHSSTRIGMQEGKKIITVARRRFAAKHSSLCVSHHSLRCHTPDCCSIFFFFFFLQTRFSSADATVFLIRSGENTKKLFSLIAALWTATPTLSTSYTAKVRRTPPPLSHVANAEQQAASAFFSFFILESQRGICGSAWEFLYFLLGSGFAAPSKKEKKGP